MPWKESSVMDERLPLQLEAQIVGLKRDKPHWGARKTRELLPRRLPGDIKFPAKSTIHAVLANPRYSIAHRNVPWSNSPER